jgi:hypothetical protein
MGVEFIDSWQWGIFMAIITIYTLFFDDLRVLLLAKKFDDIFFFLTTISFILFFCEICVSCYVFRGYFNSFFFWLDLLSTISMLFDIGWIMDNVGIITGTGGGASDASSMAKTS